MGSRSRKPSPAPAPEKKPGLLDPGPHLHLDQDLLGNQEVRDRGVLGFDNPNPQLLGGGGGLFGPQIPGIQTDGILERIANQGNPPNPLLQPVPGHPASKGPSWMNPAGVGTTVGDWNIGGKPAMSTSDEYDSPGTRDRATRIRDDEHQDRYNPKAPPK